MANYQTTGLKHNSSVRTKKSVRFASVTGQRALELASWRRPADSKTQSTELVLSPKACAGMAIIKFVISKLLYVRLPTSRRTELEEHCARLTSAEQLARWWSGLSPLNQALVNRRSFRSPSTDASDLCEVIARLSEQSGDQIVTDTLASLAIPIISSWEDNDMIARVDDTNAAAKTASKGNKAGNALGEARSRYYQEFLKRKAHYDLYEDPELKAWGRSSRFPWGYVPRGSGLQEFTFEFIIGIDGNNQNITELLGSGVAPKVSIARELAAEQALAKWDFVERTLEGRVKLVKTEPKPLRKRVRTRSGRQAETAPPESNV